MGSFFYHLSTLRYLDGEIMLKTISRTISIKNIAQLNMLKRYDILFPQARFNLEDIENCLTDLYSSLNIATISEAK